MNPYAHVDLMFALFIMCPRLFIVSKLATTPSMANRFIKWRAKNGFVQLVGKWRAPGRKAFEYYWGVRPLGARLVPHQAAIANIAASLVPHVEFIRKQFGTDKDALIPDLVFRLDGNLLYLEFDDNNSPNKVIQGKVEKYRECLVGDDAGTVLFVTSGGSRRMASLLKDVKPLKQCCVANLAELLQDIGGRVWHAPETDYRPKLALPTACIDEQMESGS